MKMYIADTDYVLVGLISCSEESFGAINFWKQVQDSCKSVYITNVGLERISKRLKEILKNTNDLDFLIAGIKSCFEVINIDDATIQKAIKLNMKDLESAIELICAESKKYVIVTNRSEDFQSSGLSNIEIIEPEDFMTHNEPAYLKQYIQDCFNSVFDFLPTSSTSKKKNQMVQFFKATLQELTENNLSVIRLEIINNYIELTRKYGSEDWGYYGEAYDIIEANWANLQIVLDYCSQRAIVSREYYYKFEDLWDNLNKFSDLYSHRQERAKWLDKLISLSFDYNEWDNYFRALTRNAWVLVLENKLEEAEQKIRLAESKIELISDTLLLFRFYHCCLNFYTRSNKIEDAERISDVQFGLIRRLETEVSSLIYRREYVNYRGDTSKVMSRSIIQRVENQQEITSQDLETLSMCLDTLSACLQKSDDINWLRGVSYYNNKIAEVKIILAQNSNECNKQKLIEEIKKSIEVGIGIAECNNNQRRLASIQVSRARLAILEHLPGKAKLEAEKGKMICEEIGDMDKEVVKKLNYLSQINS
jgi:hypothetical protein